MQEAIALSQKLIYHDRFYTLNYCHFSTVKVDSRNAIFFKFFMCANFTSSHFTTHNNALVYLQIVKIKPYSSYFKCKINPEQVISYLKLNPKLVSYLSFLQFFIVYPGISNPGPPTGNRKKDLSVFYRNVQGLIPFGSQHPNLDITNLDITKIYELQAYIFEKNPDIIILNETWLKPTILSSEIFPKQYNVFRVDWSPQSHPVDPLNPKKFRKNGGGVLIAVNNDLSLQSKIIPIE